MPEADEHPVIAKLKKAASDGKKTVVLTGYRGKSGKEGVVRIYPEPELGTYFDIPQDDILNLDNTKHTTASDAGPSTFLINAGAKIEVVRSETADAAFLKGPISSSTPLKVDKPLDDPVTDAIRLVSAKLGVHFLFGVPCTMAPCKTRDFSCP
jgi:hypothetical protein